MSSPFCFSTWWPIVAWAVVLSFLFREARASWNLWCGHVCCYPSLQSRQTAAGGKGAENNLTNEKLNPMKTHWLEKGYIGCQWGSFLLNANGTPCLCFNHRVVNIHGTEELSSWAGAWCHIQQTQNKVFPSSWEVPGCPCQCSASACSTEKHSVPHFRSQTW